MRRKSKANRLLFTVAAALAMGVLGTILGIEPWLIILIVIIVLVGGWGAAASGMSGNA